MIFFGMALMLPVVWFLPWWCFVLFSVLAGALSGGVPRATWSFAFGAALIWPALAFIKDGRSAGVISQKLSALLSLPSPGLIFVVVFILAFVTAFLSFQTGATLRSARFHQPV